MFSVLVYPWDTNFYGVWRHSKSSRILANRIYAYRALANVTLAKTTPRAITARCAPWVLSATLPIPSPAVVRVSATIIRWTALTSAIKRRVAATARTIQKVNEDKRETSYLRGVCMFFNVGCYFLSFASFAIHRVLHLDIYFPPFRTSL